MKRRIAAAAGVLALSVGGAAPAWANFPEQPGSHVQTACAQVGTNGATTVAGLHRPDATNARLNDLFADACGG